MRTIHFLCRGIEMVAGILLGAVMILIVASTFGRYAFAYPIPDSFDVSRLLVGACLFWGFAVVGLRGGHIQVDFLADLLPAVAKRTIDCFAWAVLFVFVCLLAWKVLDGTLSVMRNNQVTFDLRLSLWPFYGLIWLGIVASVFTVATKVWCIATGREDLVSAEAQEVKDVTYDVR